jgi:ribosomal protein L16/L10AE
MTVCGPNSLAPLNGQSKKQSAVSHSTPESEIVSADAGVRTFGLPALDLWSLILNRRVKLVLEEDNSAAKRVIETGRNPTMRHLNRTHKVDLRFLFEQVANGNMEVRQCPTDSMAADILNKAFTNKNVGNTHAN